MSLDNYIAMRGANKFTKTNRLKPFPSKYKERNIVMMDTAYEEWIKAFCDLYGYECTIFRDNKNIPTKCNTFDMVAFIGDYTVGLMFGYLVAYFYAKENNKKSEEDAEMFFHSIDKFYDIWMRERRKEFK